MGPTPRTFDGAEPVMPAALLGRKLGMTRYFTDTGANLPVTVIEAGPCAVTQVKTTETDQYAAVQLAFDDVKPRLLVAASGGG